MILRTGCLSLVFGLLLFCLSGALISARLLCGLELFQLISKPLGTLGDASQFDEILFQFVKFVEMTLQLLQLSIRGCGPVNRLGDWLQLVTSRLILRLVEPVLGDLQVILGDPICQWCKVLCHAPLSQAIAQ